MRNPKTLWDIEKGDRVVLMSPGGLNGRTVMRVVRTTATQIIVESGHNRPTRWLRSTGHAYGVRKSSGGGGLWIRPIRTRDLRDDARATALDTINKLVCSLNFSDEVAHPYDHGMTEALLERLGEDVESITYWESELRRAVSDA